MIRFDENGKRIKFSDSPVTGVTVTQAFEKRLIADSKKIVEYLGIREDRIPAIKSKKGRHGGGKYMHGAHEVFVNLGDGNYCQKSRNTLIHELIHSKGVGHGIVMGHKFMSRDDKLSPKIAVKIFGEMA